MASSDALRMHILRIAHSEYPRWVVRDFIVRTIQNVVPDEIDREVHYLEEKSLVRIVKGGLGMGQLWDSLQITANGIDVVEGKRSLSECSGRENRRLKANVTISSRFSEGERQVLCIRGASGQSRRL